MECYSSFKKEVKKDAMMKSSKLVAVPFVLYVCETRVVSKSQKKIVASEMNFIRSVNVIR